MKVGVSISRAFTLDFSKICAMLRKLFVVGLVSLNIFIVGPTFAQTPTPNLTVAKEFNPLCWQRKDCDIKRRELNKKAPSGDGFITGMEAGICTGGEIGEPDEWGRCLPYNVAKTEISFGGKKEFADIGAFLTNGYRLALSIASILAAIMIVVAGFQWTASGGNAGIINSAKSRIVGALIGLFIAYTSYFILYTINPNLVNLHLPQAWLLRPQADIPQYCSAIPKPTDLVAPYFYKVFDANNQTSTVPTDKGITYDLTYSSVVSDPNTSSAAPNCGKRYLAKGGGNFACFGDVCGGIGQACVNIHFSNLADTTYSCESGVMIGSVVANYITGVSCQTNLAFDVEYNPEVSEGRIITVCQGSSTPFLDGDSIKNRSNKFETEEITDERSIYKISGFTPGTCASSRAIQTAPLGYAVIMRVDRNCAPGGFLHIIGKNGVDLNKYYTGTGSALGFKADLNVTSAQLFTELELTKGGVINNLDVSKFGKEILLGLVL